ncbi:hypothetical protein LXA43DRAFT_1016598 [Ganoderma leucocontextum]|nr:hypothetical protein LXA43DRAFT_1016598 [Ganoderma leucocontextum]
MAGRAVYMNVPSVRPTEQEESFEERRVLDYLNAYRTTGRPPVPCPPQPTDPTQRAALGYPPLFQPYIGVEGGGPPGFSGAGPTASTSTPGVLDFAAQVFRPTETTEFGTNARFQSLVAQPEYLGYSPEECRVEAYKMGKKTSDAILPQPLLLPSISVSASQSTLLNGPADSIQSINSMPPYDQHSVEELRLAFQRGGRPLNSSEIVAQNAVLRLTV